VLWTIPVCKIINTIFLYHCCKHCHTGYSVVIVTCSITAPGGDFTALGGDFTRHTGYSVVISTCSITVGDVNFNTGQCSDSVE